MAALTNEQKKAYSNLGIKPENKIVLCLDGGGIRGILTLQLLKKIEEIAGLPCHQFCDMAAGTSTGGIIAGLIAFGKTAAEIEALYIKLVTKVFLKRGLIANRFLNPPEYDKINYRTQLKSIIADSTLEDACKNTNIDLMITAKDMEGNEETFFTCFQNNGTWSGTYKDALLRTVMEATMSAPTYFRPLDRFIDGGTTSYNNPSMAAAMEAVTYGGKNKYSIDQLTLISLGTGTSVRSVTPQQAANPGGIDAYFWLNYVMGASGQDASTMQTDLFRSGLMKSIDFRRFQISLDTSAIGKLPNKKIDNLHIGNANWLSELQKEDLNNINLDDVSKFDLMKVIGEAMVDYIMQSNKFKKDLNDTPSGRDELVTAFDDTDTIKTQISSADWIDNKVPAK